MLEILAYSAFMPTEDKMLRRAIEYEYNDVFAFGYFESGVLNGVIALRRVEDEIFEIISIGVDPARRGVGIGGKLIDCATKSLNCSEIRAETDDDAVKFYRKRGFVITSLGEKHPGTIRYLCALRKISCGQRD